MDRFIIHYRSVTLASIAKRAEQQTLPLPTWLFEFPELDALQALGDTVEPVDGVNIHTGLGITVQNHAANRDEAETLAKNLTEHLLNLVTFSTLASCDSAQVQSIVTFHDGQLPKLRSYQYPFEKQELLGSLAVINENEFREIFDAFNRSSNQARVARALSWLRKGINEENFVDEFIAYWIGLEVVTGVLRRMLKMSVRDPGEWDGLRDAYERELKFSNFDHVNTARNRLLHGFEELSDTYVQEIGGYLLPTRQCLIASVVRILGLSQTTRDSLLVKPVRRLRRNPWQVEEWELENLPEDFGEVLKNVPRVKPTVVERRFSITSEGA